MNGDETIAGESEYGGSAGIATPKSRGGREASPRPHYEQLVADYALDPSDDGQKG